MRRSATSVVSSDNADDKKRSSAPPELALLSGPPAGWRGGRCLLPGPTVEFVLIDVEDHHQRIRREAFRNAFERQHGTRLHFAWKRRRELERSVGGRSGGTVIQRQQGSLRIIWRLQFHNLPFEGRNGRVLHAAVEIVRTVGTSERFFEAFPHGLLRMRLLPLFFGSGVLFCDC